MASLEDVMNGWLRSRRLMVASVAAGRGCKGLRPRPLLRQGGGVRLGDFCSAVGALVGVVGGGPSSIPGDFPGVLGAPVGLVHLPLHGGLLIRGPGNGARSPSKSSPDAIICNSRAKTKHTSKVYNAAPPDDRLGQLICAVIFVLIHSGCFAKLGPLQRLNFFTSIH